MCLMFGVLAMCSATLSNAQSSDSAGVPEHRVKAAFLYRFIGYVEWPGPSFASPDAPLTIAVMGADLLATDLIQMLPGRPSSERPIIVRRFKAGDSLAGIHVLFVGKNESSWLAQLSQAGEARSILIVTETEGTWAQSSVINFVISDRRVRFEVALDTAEKAGLKLSSRLLAVAQRVKGAP